MNAVDTGQIPHLRKLLDDDAPSVRDAVAEALAAFGPDLKEVLEDLSPPLSGSERRRVRDLLEPRHQEWVLGLWPAWMEESSDLGKLEIALSILSDYLGGYLHPRPLSDLLDELATSYLEGVETRSPEGLARYLFQELEFAGNEEGYDDPSNNDLVAVIRDRRGIPITLALVFILVGDRLGMNVEGCNFPGHFLARIRDGEHVTLVDCFHGGRTLSPQEVMNSNPDAAPAVQSVIQAKPSAETVLIRVLNNLVHSYENLGDPADSQRELMLELRRSIETHEAKAVPVTHAIQFEVGELVRHRRYGYRGVVVSADAECRADETWYRKNSSQPERDQPWYSVLVHGTVQVTYAAQTSLLPDDEQEPVKHPLLGRFFSGFLGDRYQRNEEPWPGWE